MARIVADRLHTKARAIVDQIAALPQLPTLTPVQARGRPVPLEAAPEASLGLLRRELARATDALRAEI